VRRRAAGGCGGKAGDGDAAHSEIHATTPCG
jgi:hypothetical protein